MGNDDVAKQERKEMLKEVIKKLKQNKMTLLVARLASGKIGLTLEIIKELGINQNKRRI